MRMIWKTSRNEKHKYFDEETLPHSEKKNTIALINIVQGDNSNDFAYLSLLFWFYFYWIHKYS